MKDSRIEDLYSLIDTGNYDLLSFDVFDTTVWRMVPNPLLARLERNRLECYLKVIEWQDRYYEGTI